MKDSLKIVINQKLIHYKIGDLERWRIGDSSLVPKEVLEWKGPGRANGYGFAEFTVGNYLKEQGYEVIVNSFNLFSTNSKYKDNNQRIRTAMGNEKYDYFTSMISIVGKTGKSIEQPDICVIGPKEFFFVEAKRNKDFLRYSQKLFALISIGVFDIPFYVYKLLPEGEGYDTTPIII